MKAQKFLLGVSHKLTFSNHLALGTPDLGRTLLMIRLTKISELLIRCVVFLYQESPNFASFARVQYLAAIPAHKENCSDKNFRKR